MQKSCWEYCSINLEVSTVAEELQQLVNTEWNQEEEQGKPEFETTITKDQTENDPMNAMVSLLEGADTSCRLSLESLDELLTVIHSIKTSYFDVTSRTNSLMSKCEELLEEQHTLQQTAETLQKTLKPFKDIEDVAQLLGIPYESIHQNSASSPVPSTPSSSNAAMNSSLQQHLDPRSSEFKELLLKLSNAVIFLQNHPDIMENQKYTIWLEKLQIRAISLIGRAMRELIDKTAKQCRDIIQQKLQLPSSSNNNNSLTASQNRLYSDDQPIESLPVYQKFRGLSFRMKELVGVLLRGYLVSTSSDEESGHTELLEFRARAASSTTNSNGASNPTSLVKYFQHLAKHDYAVLAEVKKSYALIRMELLQPFLQEAFVVSLTTATTTTPNNTTSTNSLTSNHSGTNFSSLIAEKRSSLSNNNSKNNSSNNNNSKNNGQEVTSHLSLSTVIRYSFSTLLRIVQLEYQLFDSLFNIDHIHHITPITGMTRSISTDSEANNIGMSLSVSSTPRPTSESRVAVKRGSTSNSTTTDDPVSVFASDLSRVIEYLSNSTRDFLRPLIIRESSVDELCRVISILSEDIKSQIMILHVPKILMKQLHQGLDYVMNDSKERLIYCAETKLRQEIQFYEPLPSHLAYPDILELYDHSQQQNNRSATPDPSNTITTTNGFNPTSLSIQSIYDTWYPPMRLTLSLLSKLYGVIDTVIFEDFARRCLEIMITILHQGSEQMKRQQKAMMIHGDLFLVRHLLILREQLIPFEVKLQSSEKWLDFTNTRAAFQQLLTTGGNSSNAVDSHSANAGALVPTRAANSAPPSLTTQLLNNLFLRFDDQNLLVQFAKSGVPAMKEMHHDMKKELDHSLKKACIQLKLTAAKFLLGPLDSLLAKVVAFIGEIPYQSPEEGVSNSDNKSGVLTPEQMNLLKNQSFLRYERMKECIDQSQHLLIQRIPDLKGIMKLYVDNISTRTVLMKSILQEFEISKLKMDCIIHHCLEATQQKELETTLQLIYRKITNECSNI